MCEVLGSIHSTKKKNFKGERYSRNLNFHFTDENID
jgi:hypothetical protein